MTHTLKTEGREKERGGERDGERDGERERVLGSITFPHQSASVL